MAKFFYGARRDPHDVRDDVLRMMLVNRLSVGELDIFSGLDLPVYNQLELGSCEANAGVLYRRWLAQQFPRYSANDQDLSRLFLYYKARELDGDQDSDTGTYTRNICKVICNIGICPEADFPYNIKNFATPPNFAALSDSTKYRAGAYHRIPDGSTVISCLVGPQPYPTLIGVRLFESFESIGSDGVMSMPEPGEQPVGGHAMIVYGYSSSKKCYLVRNSWGIDWGLKGDLLMPEAYLDNQDLSQPDMAIIHLGPAWR